MTKTPLICDLVTGRFVAKLRLWGTVFWEHEIQCRHGLNRKKENKFGCGGMNLIVDRFRALTEIN